MCLSNIKDTSLEFLCSNQKFEEVFMNNLKAFVYVLTITAISLNLKIYDTKKSSTTTGYNKYQLCRVHAKTRSTWFNCTLPGNEVV